MTTTQDAAPRLVIDVPPGFTGLTVTGDSEQDVAQVQALAQRDVRVVELTAGPAMVAASAGEYRLPPEITGQPETVVRPEFKAEFQLPTPDGKRLVVMAVTTDSEAGWSAVAAEAMRIANSIRFEEPPAASAADPG